MSARYESEVRKFLRQSDQIRRVLREVHRGLTGLNLDGEPPNWGVLYLAHRQLTGIILSGQPECDRAGYTLGFSTDVFHTEGHWPGIFRGKDGKVIQSGGVCGNGLL